MTGDQLTASIETVARNVQQISALVNDILFLQELDLVLPDFQAVDMNDVAHQVVERYAARAADRDVKLSFKPSAGLPAILGDAKSLERALMALVDNAIKFSSSGGDVAIRLSASGDKVFVAVQDHGIGIPRENLPRIFDRFYHLEKSGDDLYSGIGLGLAITRQVIAQHQGSLDVVSDLGKGSTFTVTLKKWP
jgi:signal transduction histidine kinase